VPNTAGRPFQIAEQADDLIATVTTKAPLAGAALATGVPTAQIVVRWQLGNVLYFAAAEANAASGATTYYGGKTSSVDLCSVSGCKPNYLTYNAAPAPDVASGTGSSTGNRYVIKIPLSAVGSPTSSSLLEERPPEQNWPAGAPPRRSPPRLQVRAQRGRRLVAPRRPRPGRTRHCPTGPSPEARWPRPA